MHNSLEEKLIQLYKTFSGSTATEIIPLPVSGSHRKYFRIHGDSKSLIGAFNADTKENKAFITFAKHFHNKGLNVPEIYLTDMDECIYLQEDLGDLTLFDFLDMEREGESVPSNVISYYKDALSTLLKFQIDAGRDLDYSVCYPRGKFDEQSIMWDLNYFKYYFLKLTGISFDEQLLEDDFTALARYLSNAESEFFMYRDFQSRNIMIKDGQLYFIDFQGGRKGALPYDVISLLWSARANLSYELRTNLLEHYRKELVKYSGGYIDDFDKYYNGFLLIRILQTLGAYGYRGYIENKKHFLESIPFGINNLKWLLDNKVSEIKVECRELFNILAEIVESGFKIEVKR